MTVLSAVAAGLAAGVPTPVLVGVVAAAGTLAAALASAVTAVVIKKMDRPKQRAEIDSIYSEMTERASDMIDKEIKRLESRIEALERERNQQAALFRQHQPWDIRVARTIRKITDILSAHAIIEGDSEPLKQLRELDLDSIGDPPPLVAQPTWDA